MDSAQFTFEFEKLLKYYEFAKKAIVLSEYANCKFPIAVSLEFRDALDHIFRCFQNDENIEKAFNDAKNHIIRAAYDAYEIVTSHYLIEIGQLLNNFPVDIISKILPTYFSEIRPSLIEIQSELSEIRTIERGNYAHEKCFEIYNARIEQLISYSKLIVCTIPLINEQFILEKQKKLEQENLDKKKAQKQELRNWIRLITGAIIGISGTLIIKYLLSNL